jgi:hypothetical protein
MAFAYLAPTPLDRTSSQGSGSQFSSPQAEMSLAEYRRWVDAMVSRPESLLKARKRAPGKTLKRNAAR